MASHPPHAPPPSNSLYSYNNGIPAPVVGGLSPHLAKSAYGTNPPLAETNAQLTPVAAAAPGADASPGSYFPAQYPPARSVAVDETLSNTLANSHIGSPLAADGAHQASLRQPKFTEEWDASVRGSSIIDTPAVHQHPNGNMQRSSSISSRSEVITTRDPNRDTIQDGSSSTQISLSRGNTLKKKPSLRRGGSLKRSSSRRSMKAGSVRSLALQSSHDSDEQHSVFYCPVPTSGNPTEVLANRFASWRKVLKDLIAYFREIQTHYEHRSKSLLRLANVLNNTQTPAGFLKSGGLDDALQILRNYHATAIAEANKAKGIEEDVILALTGLRSDLNQKIKEIKSLSSDFKNSVEKEMDNTKRAVKALQEVLGQSDLDPALTTGKQDPYLLRLAVDRQIERQIDEENYLHQAYLNLETSGRELESIVVGEIQKSYNAYAGILKRESDAAYNTIDELRAGPVAMPKDHEWHTFVQRDDQFVDPEIAVRSAERLHYPGQDHFACQEIRAGLLERKSKYLKSYTAGWYVLSPTHLHEFKSADKTQAPVMSLYLPEQKLGSHSTGEGSSNKFVLKGRQTGGMHRGHTWVFRAESHDTMMAWYEDIKALTERTPEERNQYVQGHVRTYSRSSQRSMSSDGVVDEDDDVPFTSSADAAAVASPGSRQESLTNRPQPGGRFPSDLQVNAQRGLQAPLSPSSSSGLLNEYAMQGANDAAHQPPHMNPPTMNVNGSAIGTDYDTIAAAAGQPGSGVGNDYVAYKSNQLTVGQNYGDTHSMIMEEAHSRAAHIDQEARQDGVNPYNAQPVGVDAGLYARDSNRESLRAANAPVVVAGPGPASMAHINRGHSEDSGNVSGEYVGQQMDADWSSKASDADTSDLYVDRQDLAHPGAARGAAVTQDLPSRPKGTRTDSVPHIPGEYPKTPAVTPGAA